MVIPTRPHGQLRTGRRQQHGNGLLYAMLGMAIVSTILAALMARNQDQRVFEAGAMEGAIAKNIAGAATAYITEYYPSLTATPPTSIVRTDPTTHAAIYTVDTSAVLHPTVEDLNKLGYLTGKRDDLAVYTNGRYRIAISPAPACAAATFCDLSGIVYLDTPVTRKAGSEVNGVWIAGWLKETGANGGYSFNLDTTTSANITFRSGAASNPVGPTASPPAGIVAIRFAYNAQGNSQFVRMNETRPVELLNTLAVGPAPAIPASAPAAGLTVRQGDVSVQVGGVAAKLDVTAQRNVTAKFDVTAEGNVIATGNIKGNQIVPTGSFVPGAACTNAGALANANNSPLYAIGWVACQGGLWVAVATVASANDTCSNHASDATTTGGAKLVCFNGKYVAASSLFAVGQTDTDCPVADEGRQGYDPVNNYIQTICRRNPGSSTPVWYRLQDLTNFKEFISSDFYADGDSILKPVCPKAGGQERKPIVDFSAGGSGGSNDGLFGFTEMVTDNGPAWTMSLKDGSGLPLQAKNTAGVLVPAKMQVLVYCYTT